MEVKEAVTHFGTRVATGYQRVRHWNSEGIEGLRPKKITGRPPRLNEDMLGELNDRCVWHNKKSLLKKWAGKPIFRTVGRCDDLLWM